MTSLERLKALIYHEKQQPGSMLCAQHALNSLLQGNYFTAIDLSDIARQLDSLEGHYDYSATEGSTNMDDTGFFSVQVLEHALNIWGIGLVRWRSEVMRPYQSYPHVQLGFILNQNQHWYTLRRFGTVNVDPAVESGNGHWFNLNSSEPSPQWVSKLYLDAFLQQAESDGYSVFVVTQLDNTTRLALPRTRADEVASTIPESAAASGINQRQPSITPEAPAATSSSHAIEGFEDEDMELQAALQASLAGGSSHGLSLPSVTPAPRYGTGRVGFLFPPELIPQREYSGDAADVDPVAASMERNRAIMQRTQREQEMALHAQYEEEAARFGQQPRSNESRDEDENIRRAIEESRRAHESVQTLDDDDEDGDDEEYHPAPPAVPSFQQSHRVYDDDDAELQAALRASLEDVPPGFMIPSTPPPRVNAEALRELTPPAAVYTDDTRSEADTSVVASESSVEEAPSVDEIRRRRLARFGG